MFSSSISKLIQLHIEICCKKKIILNLNEAFGTIIFIITNTICGCLFAFIKDDDLLYSFDSVKRCKLFSVTSVCLTFIVLISLNVEIFSP